MAQPFVLPASTYVGGVTLQVADLSKSLDFYQRFLGFDARDLGVTAGARIAALTIRGAARELVRLSERSGVRRVPLRGRLGLYHFAILLPARGDLGRLFRHAALSGVHAGAADHLFSEALYLTDPDGITVEVYRDRPRQDWVMRHGELVATSDPLDADGLIDAAGSEPWSGLPVGTTMGHVHFYVSDLDEARRFYVAALGFETTIRTFPGALFVSAGGYHHHVGLNIWAAGAPVATDADARLIHWDLVVPDRGTADDLAGRVAEAGYAIDETDGVAVARDPWGIAVRLRTPDVE